MNELALTICREYIDGLVAAMDATADVRARFKINSKPGFLTDVNETLDTNYMYEGEQVRLLDHFLADVKDAGGNVQVYTGEPSQRLSHFEVVKAFERAGEEFSVTPKPVQDWTQFPPVVFENDQDLRNLASIRGYVAFDPWDEGLEEFLMSWKTLRDSVSDAAWQQQREELLSPFLGH